MESLKQTFSRNFKALLKESGRKQVEIARDLSTTTTTIQRWLTGESFPSETNAVALGRALGVAPQELFRYEAREPQMSLPGIFQTLAENADLVELIGQVDKSYLKTIKAMMEDRIIQNREKEQEKTRRA